MFTEVCRSTVLLFTVYEKSFTIFFAAHTFDNYSGTPICQSHKVLFPIMRNQPGLCQKVFKWKFHCTTLIDLRGKVVDSFTKIYIIIHNFDPKQLEKTIQLMQHSNASDLEPLCFLPQYCLLDVICICTINLLYLLVLYFFLILASIDVTLSYYINIPI